MPQQLTPAQFVANWKPVELSERAAGQEHFIDLCRLVLQRLPDGHELAELRKETDQRVLGNLLRLNLQRA